MNKKISIYIALSFIIIISLVLIFLRKDGLTRIKKSGKLTVITDNNANCYYIYKNEPMGFQYELIKGFAEYLNVELEIITPDWHEIFDILDKNETDIIASDLTITENRLERIDFSEGYLPIQQYIITHKNNRKINELKDLSGQTIHIRGNTSYEERLQSLANEGYTFELKTNDDPSEEFIRRVSEEEINLTVSDSHIAQLNRRYYPNIQMAFPIEEEQWLAWAVKKGNKKLLDEINSYFTKIKENGNFAKIYEKYYANIEIFDYVDLVKFHERLDTRLPKYLELIKKESEKYNFDWSLVASLIYQESHFDPNAKSYTGVRGLMQITQTTAKEMGIKNRLDPIQSIKGGTKYLNKIYKRFDDIEESERMFFTLASYNIGYGHVRDAQKIAIKEGKNPNIWDTMEEVLPLLRYRKYYKETKYGYARGTEPVRYVNRIRSYYEILRRKEIES